MTKIYLPLRLRQKCNNQAWLETQALTIQDAINELIYQFPSLKSEIFSGNMINHHTRIFINQKIEADFNRKLNPTDHIHIIQAIAGG